MTSISTFTFYIKLGDLYIDTFSGRIAHGAFLEFLRSHNEELAQELHESNTRRPYSITSFSFGRRNNERIARFNVNTHDKRMVMALMEILLDDSNNEIFIIEQMCEIYEIKYKKWHIPAPQVVEKGTEIRFRFKSPVVFANSSRDANTDPFPHLSVIFEQMLKTYSRIVEDLSNNELALFVHKALDQIATPHFRLSSKHMQLGHKIKVTGFGGTILFVVEDPDELELLLPIVKLTQAWGLGGKTTMGFGQVEVEIKSQNRKTKKLESKAVPSNGRKGE